MIKRVLLGNLSRWNVHQTAKTKGIPEIVSKKTTA
jgi:hypothetical protein